MIKGRTMSKMWGLKLAENGYVKYNDYLPMHWKVHEEHYGKKPTGYQIHHIDWDKQNNHPSNLIALPPEVHARAHAEGTPKKPILREQLEQWALEWEGKDLPHITTEMRRILEVAQTLQIAQLRHIVDELDDIANKKAKVKGTKRCGPKKTKGQKRKERLKKRKKKRARQQAQARKGTRRKKREAALKLEKTSQRPGTVVRLPCEVG